MNYFSDYLKNDYCHNCKSKTQRDYLEKPLHDPITEEYFIFAECNVCKKKFLYIYEDDEPKGEIFPKARVSGGITKVKLVRVFPKYSTSKTDYVPKKISETYDEALRCMDNYAPNGAVAMFRRALQQICIKKEANKGERLEDQVNVLPEDIRPSATELRQWGNLGAHEDNKGIIDSVKMSDANLAKEFLERVFYAVYEYPEKLKLSQKSRNSK